MVKILVSCALWEKVFSNEEVAGTEKVGEDEVGGGDMVEAGGEVDDSSNVARKILYTKFKLMGRMEQCHHVLNCVGHVKMFQ